MVIGSPNVSNFDFSVVFDISQSTPKAIITDISDYIASSDIIGINFKVVDPQNVVFHNTIYPSDIDVSPLGTKNVNLIQFNGATKWGVYKVYATLIDEDGTQYQWSENGVAYKSADLCKPNKLEFSKYSLGGANLDVNFDCDSGVLVVNDLTPYSYKGKAPFSTETNLVLSYPSDLTGTVATQVISFLPVSFPFNITGLYDLTGQINQTYKFSDTVSVKAGYYYSKNQDVQCGYSLCNAACDYANLLNEVKSCPNPAEAAENQKKLIIIEGLILKAIAFKACGAKPGEILQEIQEVGGFTCNTDCNQTVTGVNLFIPQGGDPGGDPGGGIGGVTTNVTKGAMCGDVNLTITQIGSTFQISASDITYNLLPHPSIAPYVTITNNVAGCLKTYFINIDFCAAITALGCATGGASLIDEDYPNIGYTAELKTYTYETSGAGFLYVSPAWISIDNNLEYVGMATDLVDLVALLNAMGLGTFTQSGTLITAVGHHEYGILLEAGGSVVPLIIYFTPSASAEGGEVIITGSNLTGAFTVTFGGVDAYSFTVDNDSQITAIVGAGSSGSVSVTTPLGTATAAGFTFEINIPPVADAGSNSLVVLPDDFAPLDGSGSHDPDGTIASQLWTILSAPSGGLLKYRDRIYTNISKTTINYTTGYAFDLYNPYENTDLLVPVVIMLHGGAGSKDDVQPVTWARDVYGSRGYYGIAANYKTGSVGSFNDTQQRLSVQNVWRILQWITDNAATYRFDPSKVFVIGVSAGGLTAIQSAIALNNYTDPYFDSIGLDPGLTIVATASFPGDFSGIYETTFLEPGDPPNWDFHGEDDDVFAWEDAEDKMDEMIALGIDSHFTLFPSPSGHAVGHAGEIETLMTAWFYDKLGLSSSSAVIDNPFDLTTQLSGLSVVGTYVIQLEVTDNNGATDTDTKVVTVRATPPVNTPPVADAGGSTTVTYPINSAPLDGSASYDPDGTIVSQLWTRVTGSGSYTIASSTSLSTTVTGLAIGTHVFQLEVTDDDGDTGVDTKTVIVSSAGAQITLDIFVDDLIDLPYPWFGLSVSNASVNSPMATDSDLQAKIIALNPHILTSPGDADNIKVVHYLDPPGDGYNVVEQEAIWECKTLCGEDAIAANVGCPTYGYDFNFDFFQAVALMNVPYIIVGFNFQGILSKYNENCGEIGLRGDIDWDNIPIWKLNKEWDDLYANKPDGTSILIAEIIPEAIINAFKPNLNNKFGIEHGVHVLVKLINHTNDSSPESFYDHVKSVSPEVLVQMDAMQSAGGTHNYIPDFIGAMLQNWDLEMFTNNASSDVVRQYLCKIKDEDVDRPYNVLRNEVLATIVPFFEFINDTEYDGKPTHISQFTGTRVPLSLNTRVASGLLDAESLMTVSMSNHLYGDKVKCVSLYTLKQLINRGSGNSLYPNYYYVKKFGKLIKGANCKLATSSINDMDLLVEPVVNGNELRIGIFNNTAVTKTISTLNVNGSQITDFAHEQVYQTNPAIDPNSPAATSVTEIEAPNILVIHPRSLALVTVQLAAVETGDFSGSIMVDDEERTYVGRVPASYTGSVAVPLVICLHGLTVNGSDMAQITQFSAKAEAEGFIVVYPNGINEAWGNYGSARDDIGFIDMLIDQLESDYNINDANVFVCGASNGGMFTYRLAIELTDRFAAAAVVAGFLPSYGGDEVAPSKALPVQHYHGTGNGATYATYPYTNASDGIIPYIKAVNAISYWRLNNECVGSSVHTILPDTDPTDLCTVTSDFYDNIINVGATAELYTIIHGGHTWPGSDSHAMPGRVTYDINATDLIWSFFNSYLT